MQNCVETDVQQKGTSVMTCSSSSFGGQLIVPGDKSISHRVAMLCSLAEGTSYISGFLQSEDCLNTLSAMKSLGANIQRDDSNVTITGTACRFRSPDSVLDMGNSGTGLRLLTGLLAGQPVRAVLTGDASLRSRPMERIQRPLCEMGASVILKGPGGCAPIDVTGGKLRPYEYTLPVASAQVKSAILLAGLAVKGETVIIEPKETRDHTERLLKAMQVELHVEERVICMKSPGLDDLQLPAGTWEVPGDFSSAAFWVTAAAMIPGATLTVKGVGLNPRRTALLDVLMQMGADIRCDMHSDACLWEPVGDIHVRGAQLKGTEVGGDIIANVIDELPLVAVAATCAQGVTCVKDAAELRVKESDRILTMCANLRAAGVETKEYPDGFCVTGGPVRGGSVAESYGDHRMSMAMAILGLRAERPIELRDAACIATSYPTFWDDLRQLSRC